MTGNVTQSIRLRAARPTANGISSNPYAAVLRVFVGALVVVLAGYLFFNRAFAWLHIPGTPLFVGELVIAVGVVQAIRVLYIVPDVLRRSRFLQILAVYMAFGAARMAPDLVPWGMDAIRDSAIWYYGVVALLVVIAIRIGSTSPEELATWYRRAVPLFLVWAPAAVAINRVAGMWAPRIPGTETSLLSFKPGDMAVHTAAALAFLWICDRPEELRDIRARHVLTAVGLVSLMVSGSQNRGGLVTAAVMLGLTILVAPARRAIIASGTVIVAILLIFGFVTDFTVDLGRRQLSVDQIRENIASLVEPDRVQEDGTVQWRLEFWGEVIGDTFDQRHGPFGIGFGPNLAHYYDFRSGSFDTDQPLRSAHNSHVTLLARTGFGGAGLWIALWASWFAMMIRVVRRSRGRGGDLERRGWTAAWLMVLVLGMLVNAVFDPTLEGPQVAIWLWTAAGVGVALAWDQASTNSASTPSRSRVMRISSR